MNRIVGIMLTLLVSACRPGGTGTDRDARPTVEAPAPGRFAYVILTAADIDRGWDLLEVMDTELPALRRARIQARGLVSGGSRNMMIRFAGDCAADDGFVAAVRTIARRHGVTAVRCAPTLPQN